MGRRLRGNTRGKKIYWRSPTFYFDGVGSTPVDGRLKYFDTGSGDYVFQNQRWIFRTPLFIDGYAFGSDLDTANCTFVFYIDLDGSNVYQSDGFSDSLLTADDMVSFPYRSGEKVRITKDKVYSLRVEDIQNRSNECFGYIYGHYYVKEHGGQINYESPIYTRFGHDGTFRDEFLMVNHIGESSLDAINTDYLFEDYNPVFVTKIGFNRQLTATRTFQIRILLNQTTVIDTAEFAVGADLDQQIQPITGFWIKPGDTIGFQVRVTSAISGERTCVRLFGYRRQMSGKYRFSENAEFNDDNQTNTIVKQRTQRLNTRPGFNYLVTWNIVDIEGFNICMNGTNPEGRTRLVIDEVAASDFRQSPGPNVDVEEYWTIRRNTSFAGRYNTKDQLFGYDGSDFNNNGGKVTRRTLMKVCF